MGLRTEAKLKFLISLINYFSYTKFLKDFLY